MQPTILQERTSQTAHNRTKFAKRCEVSLPVVARQGATLDEAAVKRHALANAPAYQHPRMVIFLAELPLAGPGKIDRNALTRRARALWQDVQPAASEGSD